MDIHETDQSTPSSIPNIPPSPHYPAVLPSSADEAVSMHAGVKALRSLLLLPIRYPFAFQHMAIDCPRGLLLSGPPGVGKVGKKPHGIPSLNRL